MGLFTRKSKWDLLRESATAVAGPVAAQTRKLGKVAIGVAAGAAGVTAASAVISSVRRREDR